MKRILFISFISTATAALGCTGPDWTGQAVTGPAFGVTKTDVSGKTFQPVSGVIEKRCGTLDCHGSTFRPLRIYGQDGLRFPVAPMDWDAALGDYAQYYSGGGGIVTTPTELLQNYESMIGLEPELTSQVVLGQIKPEALTLIRKPRLAEKHKGGQIWLPAKDGDLCVTSWLQAGPAFTDGGTPAMFNTTPCMTELSHP